MGGSRFFFVVFTLAVLVPTLLFVMVRFSWWAIRRRKARF
jgi:hypothetical protein